MKKYYWFVLLMFSGLAHAEVWEDMLPKIAQSKAQVLFLADVHTNDFHKQALDELIVAVHQNDPNLDCLLYELDPSWYQKALEDTISQRESYTSLASRVFLSTPQFVQLDYGYSFFKKLVPQSFPEHIFQTLRETGVKILGIDVLKTEKYLSTMNNFPDIFQGKIPTAAEWDERNRMQMIERNAHMSKRILESFLNGTCKRAIAFLGEDHITQVGKLNLTDETLSTVPQQVSGKLSVEIVAIYFGEDDIAKRNKRVGPQTRIGGLEYLPLSEVTYVPTISHF